MTRCEAPTERHPQTYGTYVEDDATEATQRMVIARLPRS